MEAYGVTPLFGRYLLPPKWVTSFMDGPTYLEANSNMTSLKLHYSRFKKSVCTIQSSIVILRIHQSFCNFWDASGNGEIRFVGLLCTKKTHQHQLYNKFKISKGKINKYGQLELQQYFVRLNFCNAESFIEFFFNIFVPIVLNKNEMKIINFFNGLQVFCSSITYLGITISYQFSKHFSKLGRTLKYLYYFLMTNQQYVVDAGAAELYIFR